MMNFHKPQWMALPAAAALLTAGALPAAAALVWTGGGDGISLFQEANFLDDNGFVPAAGTINPNTAVTADTGGLIEINAGTGSPSAYGNNFSVGVGNDLAVGGGKTLASSSTGGINLGVPINSSPNQALSITGGSTVRVQFIADFDISVDGGSTLQFKGGGNPVNSSTINILDTASVLRFNAETITAFNAEHASKTTFQGNALVFGADPAVVEPGDNAVAADFNNGLGVEITFVPEPTSLALLAMGGGLMARRRR